MVHSQQLWPESSCTHKELPPFTLVINPRRACAARVTVLGLCVCVCVCVCLSPLILALQGPSRLISDTNGSSATSHKGSTAYVAILLKRRCSRDMALKQATKPPTSTDRYRLRLSGTLAVLRWRGASARTITRFCEPMAWLYGGEQLQCYLAS